MKLGANGKYLLPGYARFKKCRWNKCHNYFTSKKGNFAFCSNDCAYENNKEKSYGTAWKDRRQYYGPLFKLQNGKCAICKSTSSNRSSTPRFCVDHDRATGKVRGLLCHNCNAVLGWAKDNEETLKSAIIYLRRNINT